MRRWGGRQGEGRTRWAALTSAQRRSILDQWRPSGARGTLEQDGGSVTAAFRRDWNQTSIELETKEWEEQSWPNGSPEKFREGRLSALTTTRSEVSGETSEMR